MTLQIPALYMRELWRKEISLNEYAAVHNSNDYPEVVLLFLSLSCTSVLQHTDYESFVPQG